jgi:hypothetical protein
VYGPSNGVPSDIGKVENQVFWFVVFWSSEDFGPVLEICPGFFLSATTERRESSEELEEDAP